MQTEFIWNDVGELVEVLKLDDYEPALSTYGDVINKVAHEENQLAGVELHKALRDGTMKYCVRIPRR